MVSPSNEQINREEIPTVKDLMHKTKIIQFFGRTTPIILQKDNGPCPLLAISYVSYKDEGYVENQQQNISDAIDLLPQLTTGIDVNIKFTRINDFELTRECAIFDLLDIPLYHGWIVDPHVQHSSIHLNIHIHYEDVEDKV
ncbi:hypothetical protein LXL04_018833 [Taraxacum kok-saghyz]